MSVDEPVDFALLFAAQPAPLLVLAVDERFTIRAASDAYLAATHARRDALIGRPLFDVVGDEPALRASLARVLSTRRLDTMALDAGDAWAATNVPVLAPDGNLRWILHRRQDPDARMREFIATLLRELRNPLAPLRYALGVLRTQTSGDPAAARARTVMERQVDNLVRLVDDLLEISRVGSGAIELRREVVDLAGVVASAVETSEPFTRAGDHTVEVDLPTRPLWLEGDAVRLTRIIGSLLDNAARYSERGSPITLRAGVDGARVRIAVRDRGRGFERSPEPGIGLALARGLAELHGGTITAHSEGEGQGAEFVLTLPLVAEHAATVPVRCRVLVADDNRDAADTLAFILRDLGAEVAVTYNGAEAADMARTFVPDLALLDIGMPVLDGYAAAKRIRSEAGSRRLTLVALTGWGQADDIQRARDAGFDEHLVKPATFEALHALLASATR